MVCYCVLASCFEVESVERVFLCPKKAEEYAAEREASETAGRVFVVVESQLEK